MEAAEGLGAGTPQPPTRPGTCFLPLIKPSQISSQLAPCSPLSLSGIFVLFSVTELSHLCLSLGAIHRGVGEEGPGSQRKILNHQSRY